MQKKYKWGILAPGKMSAKFTRGLKLLDNALLYAVGSRELERAEKFAQEYGFEKSYGSYEELAADPEVDIIYIASPHSHHFEHAMLCLRNSKSVICEKAFALNSREAELMIREAAKQKVFLMEALWPPFQPMYIKAKQMVVSGEPGKLLHLNARFSFQAPYDPLDRKFNLELGGGSLLDIGIYPVIDALWFMGVPDEVVAKALFAETGSEHTISIIFRYNDGRMATLYSSFMTAGGIGVDLLCEKGNIYFTRARDMSQRLRTALNGQEEKEFSLMPEGMGYQYEASEVMKCLDEGRIESPVVPHSFTLDLMKTLDRIRESAGIEFPGRE
ncbi:MAG TPA: Gfo/Idh/MocA family oxidoreductase [Bacteroidales bacterium]|nr:Gfo/Idh/MocA family oxidoreductase [Bacteroidales bacterium]